ncbi:UDP-2,3-diacylglucosamine diphosphatase [Solimonas soli]|uniref:UDP-2,3-diacylglucosamine diphosphatase n=1 Tax=Solimonas soli TaxID=413479 RepID=UPI0004B4A49C|nr:UDP-2,3-diacylglucosamine diphosphatase [Solimonas soli]
MILLLSDLHLPNESSPLREGFLRFLAGPARRAQAVYILGDLFEYWVGDDVGLEDYAPEIAALRALTASGVAVFFMAGNRDFLVGQRFARATGVRIVDDPLVVELGGVATLLSHGDLLCSDDRGYQRWRRLAHSRLAQWLFLRLPKARRHAIAGGLRRQSGAGKRNKPAAIMDVNAQTVQATLRRHGVTRLIHGHTHRPADHLLRAGTRRATRLVLADWHEDRMEYLAVDAAQGCVRRRLDAPSV